MSIQLSGYHIIHTPLTKTPIICKLSKDGKTITHKQDIDYSEVLKFIIDELNFYDNEIKITENGKVKYKIILTKVKE